MTYLGRLLVALDQLGNAIAGGNPDSTISARLGYLHTHRPMLWTTFLMDVVDITFYSVDGFNHCFQAYESDKDEKFRRGSDVGLAVMGILVVVFCIILVIPIWVYSKFS